jgi:glycosyltransferase involved in cell wall biosynthesis
MVGRHETGNETYALGLLTGFQRIGFPVDTYSFQPLAFPLHRQHRAFPHSSMLRIPVASPLLALRDRLELYHATYVLPPFMPCPTVVTVHDITFALRPEWFSRPVRTMLQRLVPVAMRQANRVLTISENTKRDIVARFGLPPEKVVVTYLAPRPTFSLPEPRRERDPFFLAVGNVEPRKNLRTLVLAFGLLHSRCPEATLIIAGNPGPGGLELEMLAKSLGLAASIRFLGYVQDDELRRLYSRCTAHVHPAWYEGFGLTILEAMAQAAPVVASNTSSIPEVTGDAALLVDPARPGEWADAMERVLRDRSLQRRLRERGQMRAELFSWERCANQTVGAYRSALR